MFFQDINNGILLYFQFLPPIHLFYQYNAAKLVTEGKSTSAPKGVSFYKHGILSGLGSRLTSHSPHQSKSVQIKVCSDDKASLTQYYRCFRGKMINFREPPIKQVSFKWKSSGPYFCETEDASIGNFQYVPQLRPCMSLAARNR